MGSLLGLCLAGPTGAGKTALAMAFARASALAIGSGSDSGGTAVEIISVDSALVYRGMDIGTAKPSAEERAEVPHHLIDILDPRDAYSAAAFVADARRIAAEIRARGRLPLLVGGTMLYFKALREGLDAMPAADPVVRAALDAEAAARGWPALHAELARVDPVAAQRIAPLDAQRIQRALEVWRVSGRPLSSWQGQGAATAAGERQRWPLVSLEPSSRAWLHERLAQRFEAMLERGLLDEVRALRARGDLHALLPSMRCVGYRQAWVALESGRLGPLRATGVAATRQLAKRQLTWLRSMSDRRVVPCDASDGGKDTGALARGVAALRQAAQQGGWPADAP
ncbi:MAG: tRNA (adenosine(37)-N6)-dimethylallyltransferase MiaA [Rubrivivax sp.]|nr:tRNA (adenosine(37)-N6)-dimethylallyltransferase MiaA [Rubrivivax sp.]